MIILWIITAIYCVVMLTVFGQPVLFIMFPLAAAVQPFRTAVEFGQQADLPKWMEMAIIFVPPLAAVYLLAAVPALLNAPKKGLSRVLQVLAMWILASAATVICANGLTSHGPSG